MLISANTIMEEKSTSAKGTGRGTGKRSPAETRGCFHKSGDPSGGENRSELEGLTLEAMGGCLLEFTVLVKL